MYVCMHICVFTYVYVYMHIHAHIYIVRDSIHTHTSCMHMTAYTMMTRVNFFLLLSRNRICTPLGHFWPGGGP